MSSALAKNILRNRYRIALALVLAFGLGVTLLPSRASAVNSPGNCTGLTHAGRIDCHGFFTNRLVDIPTEGAVVIEPPALDNVVGVNDYLSTMKQYLYSSDPQERTSSAFTIAIMLGEPNGTFGGSSANGVAWAKANFDRWATVVNYYDSHNLIDWNVPWSTNSPYEDSGYGRVIQDNYYVTYQPTSAELIIFRMPPGYAGAPFRIDRSCANIQGNDNPLPFPPGDSGGDLNPPQPPQPPSNPNPPGFGTATDSSLNSSCANISGHAFDATTPAYAVKVNLSYTISGGPTYTNQATASTTGTHLFNVPTPPQVQSSIKSVTVTAVGLDSADNPTIPITNSGMVIGPCVLPSPNCDGYTITPNIDPDTPYTITAKVDYANAAVRANVLAQANTKFFITVRGPGVNAKSTSANVGQIQQYGTGGLSYTAAFAPTRQTGTYAIGWGITGSYGPVNCGDAIPLSTVPPPPPPPTFTVSKRPYFTVDGGDVSAGAGMTTGGVDCSAAGGLGSNPNAGIVSWNRGLTGGYAGAGTKYGAFALGNLQAFATGQGSALVPSNVAFANTGGASSPINLGQDIYGGQFGSTACTSDYFGSNVGVPGPYTLPATSVPNCVVPATPATCRRVIYVNGDAHITGNVTFSGSYGSPAEVPSFSLVVKGNIYIDPGVTQLDGFYIAQPPDGSSNKGIIYSCAPSGFATGAGVLSASLQTQCNTALTVNGSFVGRQIWLLRTAGSISSTPAEQFNYSPELWLSAPFGNNLSPFAGGDYDSITSLPPVL